MSVVDDLRRAREAYERRDWLRAFRALTDHDDANLSADDFRALGVSAYLLGRRNDAVQALQRAYQGYVDLGDVPSAVRTAHALTAILWQDGEMAVGNGWLSRAGRLLDTFGDDVVERGYLLERATFGHVLRGDFGRAAELAPQVSEYGRRFADPDLTAMGLQTEGRLRIYAGEVAAGLGLLDEAVVSVLADEVTPIISGVVYCSAIEACQELSDLGRAGEWTRALTTWCDGQPGLVAFTGQCAVHRGQLMRLHGAWDDALVELERAADRYAAAGGDPAVALTHYERGEVHRLRGDHDAAAAAYEQASTLGHHTQPGLALLRLATGRAEAAATAIRRVLDERADPVHRSQVLPAAIEVLVATGDLDRAASLSVELADIATDFGCTALHAADATAAAQVALATGRADRALARAREAVRVWAGLTAPYDAARARTLVGRALVALGDDESGTTDLLAARNAFLELGARTEAENVATLLPDEQRPGGLSPREVEVLRLVAAGLSNTQIAAELVLSERTVARHLSNIFTKLDVGSRTAAAAFAHANRLV